jgi:TPR repeat protein
MAFKNSLTLLTILICVESSLTVFSPSGCHAQETAPSSETVTLVEKVQIPVEVDGKEVGKTSLPAGTKVTVVSRDGARVSIKRGNLGPVWVEQSQLSGLSDKKPEQSSKPVESDPTIELQKLNRLVLEKQWTQVAATCETMAQADEKFSSLGELAGQLTSALQAQISAVQQQKNAEVEAKRLRRNADVVGQPNRLNPSDRSPMERAQKLRDEADSVIEEAKTAHDASEAQIAQSEADISKEIGRMESEATAQIASVDARSVPHGKASESTPGGNYNQETELTETSASSVSIAQTGLQRGAPAIKGLDEVRSNAEQGDPGAQFLLGLALMAGEGVGKNPPEAVEWLQKAADQGQVEAACFLGIAYAEGKAVVKDPQKALQILKRASQNGGEKSNLADMVLGKLFHDAIGVSQDYEEAEKWWRKAAAQNNPAAQAQLAVMYIVGKGVPQNFSEAVKLLKPAVEQGNKDAQWALGLLHYKGAGVPQDFAAAAELYREAAKQGEPNAQYNLAMMYRNGDGIDRDSREAKKWFSKAAEQGNIEAKQALKEMSAGLLHSRESLQQLAQTMDWSSFNNMKEYSKVFGGYTREELYVIEAEMKRVGR